MNTSPREDNFPSRIRRYWLGLALGLCAVSALFLGLLGLTGRPVFAAAGAIGTVLGVHIVSALKFRLLAEPLVFSDFALLREALRHPHLYYAGLAYSVWGAGLLILYIAYVTVWFWLEPPVIGWPMRLLCLAIAVLILFLIFGRARPRALDRLVARVAPEPDLAGDIARFGLIGTLIVHTIRWQAGPVTVPPGHKLRIGPDSPSIIVVVQIESFADPQAWGWKGPALSHLAAARSRASIAGQLELPCAGAYTMRPEFEMLTGIGCGELRYDRFDPYLRGESFAAAALPHRLAGYETIFIHPHDRRFFRRDLLMPRFGFKRFIGEEDFSPENRIGPYIGDVGTGRRIIAEIQAARTPVFIFAVTMENHGPWNAGRIAGSTPAERYARHLVNADAMIGELMAALDSLDRPAVLALYGDHVPSLKGVPVGNTTPFVVVTWPTHAAGPKTGGTHTPAQLHRAIVELLEKRNQPQSSAKHVLG